MKYTDKEIHKMMDESFRQLYLLANPAIDCKDYDLVQGVIINGDYHFIPDILAYTIIETYIAPETMEKHRGDIMFNLLANRGPNLIMVADALKYRIGEQNHRYTIEIWKRLTDWYRHHFKGEATDQEIYDCFSNLLKHYQEE